MTETYRLASPATKKTDSRLLRILSSSLLLLASCLSMNSQAEFSTNDELNNIQIFKQASPAVVYVTNQTVVRNRHSLSLQTIPRGSGTGFIWSDKGYIVTNYHVIEGARKVTITLQDQSHWDASLIGAAPEKDLAVLRIDAPAHLLKALPVGNSSSLTVGRKVLAIGNPFGLDTTLTVGVVSALGREIEAANDRKIRGAIQTDAAINPGNSGGPLLNSEGKLVGVNTAIYSPSGASVGIGFAIPVDTVKKIVPQLIEHGRMVRPSLGVELAPEQWLSRRGLRGVPILRVTRGMPAENAGLRGVQRNRAGAMVLGDVIVGIDNRSVKNYDDLLSAIEDYQAGDKIRLHFIRNGKKLSTQLVLSEPL